MTRALVLAALLLPAACGEDTRKAPPANTVKPAAAPGSDAPAQPPPGPVGAPQSGGATASADQSMKQAMELICDAPNRVTVPESATDSERAMAMATWIKDNVTNAEALKLMGTLASVMPEDRDSMLADEAKKHGIGTCALAALDSLTAPAAAP